MLKLTDMIVSALIKKGIAFEARNFETDIPFGEEGKVIKIKAEHLTIKIDKE